MKGDSTTHTTNKKYREAYEQIDWNQKKVEDAQPRLLLWPFLCDCPMCRKTFIKA